ncbi:hypothetical protein KIPB_000632 [Kipferlia bialata]|uniref:Uncharacterized protein n=1 Tax=Kipferlia bialata TaxID=797122 RepID=A0A9K3CQV0_9EUKA|nr:hypothetical protein KIPB_000632 [Kipferlia bialata]|eukprot:g632.t1
MQSTTDEHGVTHISINDFEEVTITPVGAGQEVGRSCIVIRCRGKSVMLDCGVHPGMSGMSSLPFLDMADPETIDVCLVTHFHMDHCGAVPYLAAKTGFSGPIYMTYPTAAVFDRVITDYLRVSRGRGAEEGVAALYDQEGLDTTMARIRRLHFHQQEEFNGIRITPYPAGHVIGACQFLVEIEGISVLYSGDFSTAHDRHLEPAEVPDKRPDIFLVESTYGIQCHIPTAEREKKLLRDITDALKKGGKVLLPVFALGRSQEIALILEEAWERHEYLRNYKIFFASSMFRHSLPIYRTYPALMNPKVKAAFTRGENPFDLKHVQVVTRPEEIDTSSPCVVLAAPGMIQSGLSRKLLEQWASGEANKCVFTGYTVKGTLGHEILSRPDRITTSAGTKIPFKMDVSMVSFSAHSDLDQTEHFIRKLAPSYVVLIHGEMTKMKQLADRLVSDFAKGTILERERETAKEEGHEMDKVDEENLTRLLSLKVDTIGNGNTLAFKFPVRPNATLLGTLAVDNERGREALKRQHSQALIEGEGQIERERERPAVGGGSSTYSLQSEERDIVMRAPGDVGDEEREREKERARAAASIQAQKDGGAVAEGSYMDQAIAEAVESYERVLFVQSAENKLSVLKPADVKRLYPSVPIATLAGEITVPLGIEDPYTTYRYIAQAVGGTEQDEMLAEITVPSLSIVVSLLDSRGSTLSRAALPAISKALSSRSGSKKAQREGESREEDGYKAKIQWNPGDQVSDSVALFMALTQLEPGYKVVGDGPSGESAARVASDADTDAGEGDAFDAVVETLRTRWGPDAVRVGQVSVAEVEGGDVHTALELREGPSVKTEGEADVKAETDVKMEGEEEEEGEKPTDTDTDTATATVVTVREGPLTASICKEV